MVIEYYVTGYSKLKNYPKTKGFVSHIVELITINLYIIVIQVNIYIQFT